MHSGLLHIYVDQEGIQKLDASDKLGRKMLGHFYLCKPPLGGFFISLTVKVDHE